MLLNNTKMKKKKNLINFMSGFVFFLVLIVLLSHFFDFRYLGKQSWTEILTDWHSYVGVSIIFGIYFFAKKYND